MKLQSYMQCDPRLSVISCRLGRREYVVSYRRSGSCWYRVYVLDYVAQLLKLAVLLAVDQHDRVRISWHDQRRLQSSVMSDADV